MPSILPRKGLFLIFFAVILVGTGGVGALMRESDQANLLVGAVEIANGESLVGQSYYNYDKQYLTYWLGALAVAVGEAVNGEARLSTDRIVNDTNFAVWILYLMTLGLVARWAVERSWLGVAILFSFCFSPVVAFQAIYLNSALVSVCFLIVLTIELNRSGGKWQLPAIFLGSFLATAARIDAVLVLPALLWWTTEKPSWRSAFASRRFAAIGIGALSALLVGVLISNSPSLADDPWYFRPRVFAAYLIFGLGAASFPVFCVLWSGVIAVVRKHTRLDRAYALTGLLVWVPPILYYAVQLRTPRYLMLAAFIAVLTILLPRVRNEIVGLFSERTRRIYVTALAVLTLLPWLVGLSFSDGYTPSFSLRKTEVFPTADGVWSKGLYRIFASELSNADSVAVDHNQDLWFGATEAVDELEEVGRVRVLPSPMSSYMMLALTVQNQSYEMVEVGQTLEGAIIDRRSLLRNLMPVYHPNHSTLLDAALEEGLVPLTLDHTEGSRPWVQFVKEYSEEGDDQGPPVWTIQASIKQFGGDDHELWSLDETQHLSVDRTRGSTVLILARAPFVYGEPGRVLESTPVPAASDGAVPVHFVRIVGADALALDTLVFDSSTDVESPSCWIGVSVLPSYMSLQRY